MHIVIYPYVHFQCFLCRALQQCRNVVFWAVFLSALGGFTASWFSFSFFAGEWVRDWSRTVAQVCHGCLRGGCWLSGSLSGTRGVSSWIQELCHVLFEIFLVVWRVWWGLVAADLLVRGGPVFFWILFSGCCGWIVQLYFVSFDFIGVWKYTTLQLAEASCREVCLKSVSQWVSGCSRRPNGEPAEG